MLSLLLADLLERGMATKDEEPSMAKLRQKVVRGRKNKFNTLVRYDSQTFRNVHS